MKNRIDDIEALRAIAVLAVVIHHVNVNLVTWKSDFSSYFSTYFGGWVGVDLFFAISGFVIARTLIPKLENTQNNTEFFSECLSFWIRRIYRLIPSAWLWLFIILLLVVTFNDHGIFGNFRENWQSTIAALLNVMNFHFNEIFGTGGQRTNFVYWSLSLEEQFYLLLPIVVFVSRQWFLYLVVAAFVYMLVTPTEDSDMSFRTHAILGGVLLAIWSRHPSYQLMKPELLGRNAIAKYATFSLLLLFLLTLGADALLITKWKISLIALISLIMVYIASYGENYIIPSNPALKSVLLWFGSRSYAIYLTHIPCFFFSRELCLRLVEASPGLEVYYQPAVIIIAFSLIVICSDLNFRLVESPLRNRGVLASRSIRAKSDMLREAD